MQYFEYVLFHFFPNLFIVFTIHSEVKKIKIKKIVVFFHWNITSIPRCHSSQNSNVDRYVDRLYINMCIHNCVHSKGCDLVSNSTNSIPSFPWDALITQGCILGWLVHFCTILLFYKCQQHPTLYNMPAVPAAFCL